ncbi:LRAT domain [Dillenia turbinata]|uniref:LRAT domain n=1 Tax=Dillenia turbinata TaxID=194707 RepID=A0AAN8V3Z6_9MAGN
MVRVSSDVLVPGDHIYGYRRLHSFSHHDFVENAGIYVGERKVIHYTRTDESQPSFDLNRSCQCGFDPNKDHGVVKSCLECFLSGHRLYLVEYGVSSTQRILKRGGSCSTETSDNTKMVLDRTNTLLRENSFGEYNLLFNNCENFARFCKTGRALSGQVVTAGIILGGSVAAVGAADLALHEISEDCKNDEDQLSRTDPKLEANKEIHKEDHKNNYEDEDDDDDDDYDDDY